MEPQLKLEFAQKRENNPQKFKIIIKVTAKIFKFLWVRCGESKCIIAAGEF